MIGDGRNLCFDQDGRNDRVNTRGQRAIVDRIRKLIFSRPRVDFLPSETERADPYVHSRARRNLWCPLKLDL